jgi:hypothetical protein
MKNRRNDGQNAMKINSGRLRVNLASRKSPLSHSLGGACFFSAWLNGTGVRKQVSEGEVAVYWQPSIAQCVFQNAVRG